MPLVSGTIKKITFLAMSEEKKTEGSKQSTHVDIFILVSILGFHNLTERGDQG